MEFIGLLLCRQIPLTLLRMDMDEHRPVHLSGPAKDILQQAQIMAVNRPDIMEADLLEYTARHQCRPHAVLDDASRTVCLVADMRDTHQQVPDILLGAVILRIEPDARQVFAHATDVLVDRHLIVVEDNDELLAQIPRLVQSLEGLAPCQRTIADDSYDFIAAPAAEIEVLA